MHENCSCILSHTIQYSKLLICCLLGRHFFIRKMKIKMADRKKYVTQRQLMRLFAVKLILSYEQKCKVRLKFLKN